MRLSNGRTKSPRNSQLARKSRRRRGRTNSRRQRVYLRNFPTKGTTSLNANTSTRTGKEHNRTSRRIRGNRRDGISQIRTGDHYRQRRRERNSRSHHRAFRRRTRGSRRRISRRSGRSTIHNRTRSHNDGLLQSTLINRSRYRRIYRAGRSSSKETKTRVNMGSTKRVQRLSLFVSRRTRGRKMGTNRSKDFNKNGSAKGSTTRRSGKRRRHPSDVFNGFRTLLPTKALILKMITLSQSSMNKCARYRARRSAKSSTYLRRLTGQSTRTKANGSRERAKQSSKTSREKDDHGYGQRIIIMTILRRNKSRRATRETRIHGNHAKGTNGSRKYCSIRRHGTTDRIARRNITRIRSTTNSATTIRRDADRRRTKSTRRNRQISTYVRFLYRSHHIRVKNRRMRRQQDARERHGKRI